MRDIEGKFVNDDADSDKYVKRIKLLEECYSARKQKYNGKSSASTSSLKSFLHAGESCFDILTTRVCAKNTCFTFICLLLVIGSH